MVNNKIVKAGMLKVQDSEIHVIQKGEEDYISLTDMVAGFEGGLTHIDAWLRSKNTVDFLGVWERLNNPNFNSVEFDRIRMESGTNRFRLSAKQWVEKTNGIGLLAKTGRYGGGTFAHKDIAFEFGSWLSPEFKLYLIKEFQRLKQQEDKTDWNVRRTLAKAHYKIHTDAVKAYLIPPTIEKASVNFIYATEADLLNKALFGVTAKEWRSSNPDAEGNIRDLASIEQLIVLSVIESQNALLIEQGIPAQQRLQMLNDLAIRHMHSLINSPAITALEDKPLLNNS